MLEECVFWCNEGLRQWPIYVEIGLSMSQIGRVNKGFSYQVCW